MSATSTETRSFAIDPGHSTVRFSVRHLMISRVHGTFVKFSGSATVSADATVPTALDVTIDAASIETGEPQRDVHLRSPDFFEVERFPQLTFKSTRFEGTGESFTTIGDLTIKGVTKEVSLATTFEGRGADPWGKDRLGYEASGKIDRTAFGLVFNMPLENGGVVVGNDVKIEINVELVATDA